MFWEYLPSSTNLVSDRLSADSSPVDKEERERKKKKGGGGGG